MTLRGRTRKPTALHMLEGTARPSRINPDEPQGSLTDPSCPRWLHGKARLGWKALAPKLAELRVLTDADREALGLLCNSFGEFLEADAVIRREGAYYRTVNKLGEHLIRRHPAVAVRSDARRQAAALMARFGITPSDRSRVHAAPEDADDTLFESFLKGLRTS